MKQHAKPLIILLITLLLIGSFSGCLFSDVVADDEGGEPPIAPDGAFIGSQDGIPRDGRLSVSFVPEDSFNPYTSTSRDNLAVAGLLYEGLYALDEGFSFLPVLAESITTLDGRRFTVEIKSGIRFHNGAPLRAADVLYSLTRAANSPLFASRLQIIDSYGPVQDAEGGASDYALEITLNRVHGNLPILLTFPIIQSGTSGQAIPPGTGPFRHPDDEGLPRIVAFTDHPRVNDLPVHTVYLSEIVSLEAMTSNFNSGLLDILSLDPTGGLGEPRLASTRELRYVETTLLDYIGFNVTRPETSRPAVRQAISRAIDRAYITENIMRGHGIPSALPIHPAHPDYDEFLALQHSFDPELARDILRGESTIGSQALPDDESEGAPPSETDADNGDEPEDTDDAPRARLTFLVASGNTMRMEVATYIAASISALGYRVEVVDLPYNEFLQELEAGNFDLFYGQVRLQPDFDLTHLLTGDLAFGGIDRLVDQRVIDDFLAAGQTNRPDRLTAMCTAILAEAPIVSIGFRHTAVATQRGVVAGLRPTQENVFHSVWDWIVNV